MNEPNTQYIPLDQLASNRIRSRLKLPLGLEKNLGVNVKKTESLMQLGGIAHALMLNTSTYLARMHGIELSFHELEYQRRPDFHHARWANVRINIDTGSINKSVPSKALEKGWEKQINNAVTMGLVRAARDNLIKTNFYDLTASLIAYSSVFIAREGLSIQNAAIQDYLAMFFWSSVTVNLLSAAIRGKEGPGSGVRYSIAPFGPEIDRFLLMQLKLLGDPLVKLI